MKTPIIFAVLAFAGCADIVGIPDRVPAAEARCSGSIEIRMLYDTYGATKDVGPSWFKGSMDHINFINANGGVRGCRLEVDAKDYGYSTADATKYYEEWRNSPKWNSVVAILGWGSSDSLLLAPRVRDDRKPFLSASYFGSLAAPQPVEHNESVPELSPATFTEQSFNQSFKSDGFGFNFFAGTDYSTGARIAMFHVKSQGGKRVGFFHCSADYCKGPLPAARAHAKKEGLALGRDLILELSMQDQTTYNNAVLQYFQQELAQKMNTPSYEIVDWVWGGNTTATTAMMAKAIDAANRQLSLNVQMVVNNWGFDEQLFALCGPNGINNPCFNVVNGIMPFVAYGDNRAGDMAKVVMLHDTSRTADEMGATYRNVRYVQGYVNVLMLKLGLERVIERGDEITGENLKTALETFRGVSTGGLTDPLTFKPDDHRPQSSESIYKFDAQGKLVLVSQRNIALEATWLGW